jgi:M6 family metalloprotease-like protein
VFVDFQDTDHSKHKSGQCFLDNEEETFEFFNGDNGYERGLKPYLSNISYGQFEVQNIFPQYSNEKIVAFKANNNRAYYENNVDALINELVNDLNSNNSISSSQTLDYDNDGCIDNFTMVIADAETASESSYKANYAGNISINGKAVSSYNLLREGSVYDYLKESGVIIHEFLHTLGYPDLYRTGVPIGRWDIMSNVISRVQYPLAYFRATKTNWFTIPTVTTSQTSYSIYAASRTTYSTRNNQAVILKTEYSDTEFFVIEFRKQETGNNTYDNSVHGSGIIIYRINTSATSNKKVSGEYNPDVAYVFRPGDTLGDFGYEEGNGDLTLSFLSLESGRTTYGTSDLTKTVSDGAITYSDGTNSGIIISNVGSANDDTITFDITFTDMSSNGYWSKVTSKDDEKVSWSDSYIASNGDMYYLLNNTSGETTLYKYNLNGWTKASNTLTAQGTEYKLLNYNNSFYMIYNALESGSQYYTKLLKLNGSSWQEVYKFAISNCGNYVSATTDNTGIYVAIPDTLFANLYGYKYANNSVTDLGKIATSSYLSNTQISVENGNVAVCYREFLNNNKICVKLYKNNSWTDIETNIKANNATIKINDNKIYLVKCGENSSTYNSYVYAYNLSENSGWKQIGDMFANENITELDICFNDKTPYIVYQSGSSNKLLAKYLNNNNWTDLGKSIISESVSDVSAKIHNSNIYVNFISGNSKNINVKSYKLSEKTESQVPSDKDVTIEIPNIDITPFLFDATYYADRYVDLKRAYGYDETALKNHYYNHGIKEGRSASPCFDPVYYLNKYGDLLKAYGATNYEAAYNHFVNYGIKEGRQGSKYFDANYYLDIYSDIKKDYNSSKTYALMHFAKYGISEGRKGSSDFNVIEYKASVSGYYQKNLGTDYKKYIALDAGGIPIISDPIDISNYMFDFDLYYSLYPDLQKAYGYNEAKLKSHYFNYGIKEGRIASYVFNPKYYLNKYSDLSKAYGSTNYEATYNHFVKYGINEGRSASYIFDVRYYLSKNSDLANAYGDNYSKVLEHFVKYGIKEGRIASSEFNVIAYKNNNKDLANSYQNNYKEYFKHYVCYGYNEKRKCT